MRAFGTVTSKNRWRHMHNAWWAETVWNRRVQSIDKDLFPMSTRASEWASERTKERSRARERSEQCGSSKQVSGASKRASERMSEWSIITIPISKSSGSLCRSGEKCLGGLTSFRGKNSLAIQISSHRRGSKGIGRLQRLLLSLCLTETPMNAKDKRNGFSHSDLNWTKFFYVLTTRLAF